MVSSEELVQRIITTVNRSEIQEVRFQIFFKNYISFNDYLISKVSYLKS